MEKQIDSREDKISRIFTAISMLNLNESISITLLSKNINMHHDTLIAKLEEYEPVKNINWKLSRDKEGKIRMITKIDEDMDIRKELRDIKKEIIEIKKLIKKEE